MQVATKFFSAFMVFAFCASSFVSPPAKVTTKSPPTYRKRDFVLDRATIEASMKKIKK